ncbi:mechanosensitive ion channel family protein [Methanolapillus millepedarum]|uniref:Small-conductance mechanosensitive channel n=1 Tax=Methanolapillus millepedarum TaxID=3028296 RepID=A0AA96V2K5_9EURY|nr:Small-conductance mechanosensitive channel [Methanosarcinaceae archaeon Ac7]
MLENLVDSLLNVFSNVVNVIYDNIGTVIYILVLLLLTALVARFVNNRFVKYSNRIENNMKMDITRFTMLRHVTIGCIYLAGIILILYTIPSLRSLSSTLLLSAGVIGIVIGIAAQDTFGNIISGIALTFFQPLRVGDLVTTDNVYGEVIDVNLRQTTIKTPDNRLVIIPNSVLNKATVTNWTLNDRSVRWPVVVQVSYESDIDIARQIMMEEARKNKYVMSPELVFRMHPDVTDDVRVRMTGLDSSGINLSLDFWVADRDDAYSAECAIREGIKKRFDNEQRVTIPYPHMMIIEDDTECMRRFKKPEKTEAGAEKQKVKN